MSETRIEPLNTATQRLLWTYGGSNVAGALATTFVNLFVFVVSGQLRALAIFNGAYFLSLTFVFYGVAWLFKRRTPLFSYQWGLVLTALFYTSLLTLLSRASDYVLWLGLFYGVAQGVFWFGVNLMTFDTVPSRQRIRFYGISSALGSVTGILGPLAGGTLISAIHGMTGYVVLFALTTVVYGATFLLSLQVTPGPPLGSIPLRFSLLLPWQNKLWNKTFWSLVIRGTREGITGLAGVFLVYVATREPWAVGVYGGVTALARTVMSLWISRWVTPERRVKALWIGTLGMTASALVLLWHTSWPYVFIYGTLTGLTLPWYMIPNAAIPLDVMDHDPAIADHRVAYTLSREIGLNFGRLLSIAVLGLFYSMAHGSLVLVLLLAVTSLAQSAVAHLAKNIWRSLAMR
ncbi:MAG: MFS transporter [Sulfobacillus benefaciens]|uniref:MFS transporter n=1 Tax=Sulfobacillus benefaciens TaxID=453960 RepID=A0A2T2XBW1_9FIRM|nr:MAG: MFS transporter [Sulfobacillus benefaciens]